MPVSLWFTFLGSALVIILFGIPMALNKVPPNGLYGVRLPVTMRNRAAWDAANVHFGWWMVASGALSLGAFFGAWFLGWAIDSTATVYCIALLLPLMIGVITCIIVAYRAETASDQGDTTARDGSTS